MNIILHRPALDNAGKYHDSGATLVIGDELAPGVIAADRADGLGELVDAEA